MSKKFLRPPPQLDDDDDDDDDSEIDSDDDDEDAPKTTAKTNANLSDGGDDSDDDDSDDDDESAEEEKKPTTKKRKVPPPTSKSSSSKKKTKSSAFFDEEAEASEEEEDDEYEKEKGKDGEQMDEETRALIRQQDRRRAQAGGRFGERSVEAISREIENRHRLQQRTVDRSYLDRVAPPPPGPQRRVPLPPAAASHGGGGSRGARDDDDGGGGSSSAAAAVAAPPRDYEPEAAAAAAEVYTAVAQQSLVPSVSDPSLWMVSCATGKEQEMVYQIMNKCVAYARQGRPLGISAAIAAQSKGKVYIESFSEPAVMEAIQNVRGLLQYTMRLVPIQDMTTVMTVTSKKKPVKKDEWVRMTRGHYKGDLALVKAVKESGLKCIVQCVPRLDLTLADLPPEEARIRRRTVRPPQRFFNVQEVAALGRQNVLRRQRFPSSGLDIVCDYFEGNYYHDGYLLKEMTVGSMIKPCTEDDPPTLDELQRFQRRKAAGGGQDNDDEDGTTENEGSKMAASLLDELSELQGKTGLGSKSSGGLLVGDVVEVIEGDLVGMRGKLVSMDGTTVKIRPNNMETLEEIEFLSNQVRKYIPVGAHVKVTDGRYANETGVVVAVEKLDGETDFTAVVLTDVTNKEISVRTSQLRESAEVASGQDKLQGYELYDLVVLSGGGSANEVGVIVRVGREDFTVINNHGMAREVRPEELRGKRNSTSGRAVALDVQGNQIRVGDSVSVAEGPHKGKSATIKRMSRAQLFLHSQTKSEHAGIFVVRSRSCVLAGSRSQHRRGGASGGAGAGGVSPFSTPQSRGPSGPRGGPNRRDDGLIGKTVRVQAGQWKGYLGTVTDSTATHVQVELHSRLKKVMVVRERVVVIGDKFGATDDATGGGEDDAAPSSASAAMTMATPMHGMIGGATPAIHAFGGGATPSHNSETGDDVWRPGGSIDTAQNNNDGWGTFNNSGAAENDAGGGWGGGGGGSSSLSSSNAWGSSAANNNKQEESSTIGHSVKSEMADDDDDNDGDETPAWFLERVCVTIDGGKTAAVIKEIHADKSALVELQDKTTRTAKVRDLTMVTPTEHDTVLVTGGNEIGLEGSLVCVDGSDAILKDANDEFKIIDFVHLVKIQQQQE